MRFTNDVARPVVAAILRSPLHRTLSGGVILVTYAGRHSGRTISVPVQYHRRNHHFDVHASAPDHKTWWRNFEAERPATVLARGETFDVTGRAFRDGDDVFVVFTIRDP